MSEQYAPAAPPEATDPPADVNPAPAVSPAPSAEPVKAQGSSDPDWLPKRLEQAKSSAQSELLKALGVESIDLLKENLSAFQKLQDEQLSEKERAEKRLQELEPQAQRAAELEQSLSGYAEKELARLSEDQAAAVKDLAGNDPAKILTTIQKLSPTWKAAAPAAPAPATATPPPSTTAAPAGPPDEGNQSKPDVRAEFARAKTANPFHAADIARAHASELLPTQ